MKNQIHMQINENSKLEATKINQWRILKRYILWIDVISAINSSKTQCCYKLFADETETPDRLFSPVLWF